MTLNAAPLLDGANDTTFRSTSANHDREVELTVAGGLVAAITHDLRQPLTALEMNISAALAFLRLPAVELDGALEALHDALAQQCRMRESLRVLEDLAVHREPLCESVDPVPIVRDVVALVDSDVQTRHVSLELVVVPPVPSVFADATLMRQALLNMVLDALEATSLSVRDDKSVRLTIAQVGDTVEVAISHFGLRTEAAGIEGWGLALARSVVGAHGGTIRMEGDAEAGVRLVTRWPTTAHADSRGGSHA